MALYNDGFNSGTPGQMDAQTQALWDFYQKTKDSPLYNQGISVSDLYAAAQPGNSTGLNWSASMDPQTQALWNEYQKITNNVAWQNTGTGGGAGQATQPYTGGAMDANVQRLWNDVQNQREGSMVRPAGPMVNVQPVTGGSAGVTPLPQVRQSPPGYTSTGATGNIAGTYRPNGTAGTYAPGGSGGSGYAPGTSYRQGLNPGNTGGYASGASSPNQGYSAAPKNAYNIALELAKKKSAATNPYASAAPTRRAY